MRLGIAIILSIFLLAGCTGIPEGIEPVSDFEKSRYLGKWYEIVRLDHSFERGLDQVTANYTLRKDGGIDVINRGFNQETGEWEEAKGKAYFVSDDSTGHLKVSFFGPFYASYVVASLDKVNYQYALVTGPDTGYLWVLSREPSLSEEKVEELLKIARDAGFDLSDLIYVQQT